MNRTQKLAIIVTAQDLASGKFHKVQQELAQMGPAGRVASVGLGLAMGAAKKGEQALGHLAGRISQLAGPLGFIGLTGAVFSLGGMLEQGISKTVTMGKSVELLTGLTGLSATSMSSLSAALEHYGVDASTAGTLIGRSEVNISKLTATQTSAAASTEELRRKREALRLAEMALQKVQAGSGGKTKVSTTTEIVDNRVVSRGSTSTTSGTHHAPTALALESAQERVRKAQEDLNAAMAKGGKVTSGAADFQAKYGLALLDTNGKVKDGNQLLLDAADYFTNKLIPAQTKDAALNAIYGKTWRDLVPLLEGGKAGIQAVEAEAAKYGMVLDAAGIKKTQEFIDTQREAGTALSGLEMQAGLIVLPDFTAALRTGITWIGEHQGEVRSFFQQAWTVAEGVAAFITGTLIPDVVGIGGAIKGGWEQIPAPLRDWIVKGVVADRTINFLFGMSPIHLVVEGLEAGLVKAMGGTFASGVFGKGTVANPMITKDISGGLGATATAGTKSGLLGVMIGKAIPLALEAATLVALANVLGDQSKANAQTEASLAGQGTSYRNQASLADLQSSLAGLQAYERQLNSGLTPEDLAFQLNIDNVRTTLDDQIAALKVQIAAARTGIPNSTGGPDDRDRSALFSSLDRTAAHADALSGSFADLKTNADALSRAERHLAAATAVGFGTKGYHDFLLALRSGNTKVAIANFPGEFKYLETASDAQKGTEVYTRGVKENIAGLQRAMIGATDAQKQEISTEIRSLQGLLRTINTSILGTSISGVLNPNAPGVQRRQQHGTASGNAAGLLGLTRSPTVIGLTGEVNHEAVAIIPNPKPILAGIDGRFMSRAHAMAVTVQLHATLHVTTKLDRSQAAGQLYQYMAASFGPEAA